jgi:hypothetical protein
MAAPQVSGTIACSIRELMRERLQPAGFEQMLTLLPETTRQTFVALTPVAWMPVHEVNLAYEAMASLSKVPVEQLAAELARESTRRTLHTVWRVLLRFTTDEALAMRAPILYAKTFDTGQATSVFERGKRARVNVTGFRDMPMLSVLTLGVGIETVFVIAGRPEARVQSTRKEAGVEYLVTW